VEEFHTRDVDSSSWYLKPYHDVTMTLGEVREGLPLQLIYRHVKSHQDDKCDFDDLTRPAQLNVLADHRATAALDELHAARKTPEFYPLPACRGYLCDASGYITSREIRTLRTELPEYELRAYLHTVQSRLDSLADPSWDVTVDKEILLLVFGTFNVDVDVDVSTGCFDRIMPRCSKELSCWHEETGLSRKIVWYRVYFAIENRRVVRLQHGNNSQPTAKERAQNKAKPVSVQSVQKAAAEKDSSAQHDGSSIVHADSPQNLSLVSGMTRDAIEKHLESLNIQIRLSSRTVTQKCLPVIQELIDDQFGWVFHDAVDPVAIGLPDYFDVVKTPTHLELTMPFIPT
jgi:hypothetical protein